MIGRIVSIALMVVMFAQWGWAQQNSVTITFTPIFNGQPLDLNKNYYLPAINDSVSLETLRFYVGDFMLVDGDKEVNYKGGGYQLIDISEPSTQTITFTLPNSQKVDAVQFSIGVDIFTNASGAQGGALDPMNGMYWAWQSGYINFKLEGSSPACDTRNHFFQYHIGGYMPPYSAIQYLLIPFDETGNAVVYIHLDKLLAEAGLATNSEIMSPGEKAVQFAKLFPKYFTTNRKP